MTRKDKNNFCKLQTYYDKKFHSKVTTLKICDRLMQDHTENGDGHSKAFFNFPYHLTTTCPFCGNKVI